MIGRISWFEWFVSKLALVLIFMGAFVIPMYTWFPFFVSHNQREYDGPNLFVYAVAVHAVFVLPTLYYLVRLKTTDPGMTPRGWQPSRTLCDDSVHKTRECHHCLEVKPPRSHHCSKCGRCVLQMDHHCTFLSMCVGYHTRPLFLKFLVCAILGCLYIAALGAVRMYVLYLTYTTDHHAFPAWVRDVDYRIKPYQFPVHETTFVFISGFGYACVALGCTGLLLNQILLILQGRTQIERFEWNQSVRVAAETNPPTQIYFPYNLGWLKNIAQVVNTHPGGGTVFETCPPPSPDHRSIYAM